MRYCGRASLKRCLHTLASWTTPSSTRVIIVSTCMCALSLSPCRELTAVHSYSLQTMYRSYLLRFDGVVVERPQFLYMRVAVAIHGHDLRSVLATYELLSHRAYSPAMPTLYNAGTTSEYLASCFLYHPPADRAVSMMEQSVAELDALWSADGGVGMNFGAVPARKCVASCIRCWNAVSLTSHSMSSSNRSSGPVPMLAVVDSHARFLSSNRWRRPSSLTAYLPIWHADVHAFIVSSTHRSSISAGLRHVYPALWVPDVL